MTDWLLAPELAPDPSDVLAPLYAAADRGELHLPRCAACDLALELEQRVCDGCGAAEVAWRRAEQAGTVHAVTVVHRLEPGLVRTDRPYPVADVELAGGHRLVLAPLSPDIAPPAVGDRVAVGFRRLGEVAVPGFTTPVPEDAP